MANAKYVKMTERWRAWNCFMGDEEDGKKKKELLPSVAFPRTGNWTFLLSSCEAYCAKFTADMNASAGREQRMGTHCVYKTGPRQRPRLSALHSHCFLREA